MPLQGCLSKLVCQVYPYPNTNHAGIRLTTPLQRIGLTLDYYSLKEQPFGAIPDRRFLFVNLAHRQALGSLLSALQQGNSAVMLVGQPGQGKTTLLYHMFGTLSETITTVYLFQAPQSQLDLLRAILADLGVLQVDESLQVMLPLLRQLLTAEKKLQKRVVVVVDGAQDLPPDVLDLLWTLADPSSEQSSLQFVLSGPTMIEESIDPESLGLSYRAPAIAHLEPFDQQDTALYVDYRLRMAGYNRDLPLFTPEASALIARYSGGIPRKINNLCFTSLMLGYKERRPKIEADIVRGVIEDLGLDRGLKVLAATMEPEFASGFEPGSDFESEPESPSEAYWQRPRPVVLRRRRRDKNLAATFWRLLPMLWLGLAALLTLVALLVNLERRIWH